MVTGAGKTTFAQMCMNIFRANHPDGRFVVVVPTIALMDQWYVSLREDLHVSEDEIAFYSGEGRPEGPSLINLMVINTARQWAPVVVNGFNCMLIVDECHRAASNANSLALVGSPVATLGLSATPEREYDDLFEEVLVPTLGPIIYRYDYNQALQDGVIVPFDLVNVSVEMAEDEKRRYDEATREVTRALRQYESGSGSQESLRTKLQRRARIAAGSLRRIPIAIRLAELERGNKIMIFHENIDAAEAILRVLQARNFNATIYHSKVDPVVRRDNLRLYRRGLFDVLITCRALDEGVNVPETNVAIVASSTASSRQRIQRLGRVLRPAQGKIRARVYTIYNSKVEEERLGNEAKELVGVGVIEWLRSSISLDSATLS